MKMAILAGLALCLILTSVPASAKISDPFMEFKRSNPVCNDKGQLTFWFGDPYSRGMEASDLDVSANFTKTGKILEISGEYFLAPDLLYDYSPKYMKNINATPHVIRLVNNWYSVFKSKEGIFKDGGNYILSVTNKKLNKTVQKAFDCYGLLFSCELIDISIDKCFNKDGIFYAYFTGKGFHRQSKYSNAKEINTTSELSYKMMGPKFQFIGNSPSIVVEELGNQAYVLTYETEHAINTLDIIVLPCKGYNIKSSKTCTAPPECVAPSDCDDSDSCTRDLCVDDFCMHERTCEERPAVNELVQESEGSWDISDMASPEEQQRPEAEQAMTTELHAGDGITGRVSAGNGDFIGNLIRGLLGLFRP